MRVAFLFIDDNGLNEYIVLPMSYMGTFKSMKHCKSSLKICFKCPYIMHFYMSLIYARVCKNIRFGQNIYKGYIGP